MRVSETMVGSLLSLLSACGAAAVEVETTSGPTTAVVLPAASDERHRALEQLGRRAWDAMRAGAPERLLIDELQLRTILDSAAATRVGARRLEDDWTFGSVGDIAGLLGSAEYAGICIQGARAEPAGGVMGLRSEGWIFDRLLLIGQRPSGRRIAGWIEGTFVYTDVGFVALDLERVEQPRWEHSDLELATCELGIRSDLPAHAR